MLRTLGIVDVGCQPPQYPTLHRRWGDQSLLQWVVRRATECQSLDAVIVVVGEGTRAEHAASHAPPHIPVFVGDASDPLKRLCQALEQYRATEVVRLRLDQPFVDPELIDRLVASARQNATTDYACYMSQQSGSLLRSTVGPFGEWFSTDALRLAQKQSGDLPSGTDATQMFLAHPEMFSLRMLALPEELDREDVRLTVADAEDWENALDIYDALGSDECGWQQVASLLQHHPALRERMAVLNQNSQSESLV